MKIQLFISCLFLSFFCVASTHDDQFSEILITCEKMFLPNSMALAPGTNPTTQAQAIQSKFNSQATKFHNTEGITYLSNRLASEKDEVAKQCIQHILQTSNK